MSQTLDIIISGRDQASPAFRRVRREILQTQRAMYTLRNYYRQQNEELDLALRAYGRFTSVVRQVQMMYLQYNTALIRVEQIQQRISEAQDDYVEAVKRYGAGSRQAGRAADQLAQAQRSLRQAQMQNNMMMLGFILQTPYFLKNVRDMIVYARMLTALRRSESVATGVQTALTGYLAAAQATQTASTTAQTAADAAHTGVIWGKVAALKALAVAQLAAIPLWGWAVLAIAGGAAVGYGVAQWQKSRMGRESEETPQTSRAQQAEWGGWKQRGGVFRAVRPTVFGVGEAGPETVAILHERHRRSEWGGITVHVGSIVMDPRGQDPESAADDLFQRLNMRLRASRSEI